MQKKSVCLFIIFQLLISSMHAQQPASTLLWKISGNGLQNASYLYGTMHLTDPRIFSIGDSLYAAIEKTQGFAIELNPDDITQLVIDEVRSEIIQARKIKNMIDSREYKKYAPALSKKLKKNEDEITTYDVFKEKNKWIAESYRTGSMSTFLDAYLFDVARHLDKWTGGVEDAADQRGLLDDLIDESDIRDIATEDAGENNLLEKMIKMYINGDIEGINKIAGSADSTFHDKLLTKRNIKMARRMDSLAHERTMVFAVGAAHLPGSDGLIQLLRQKGFTVEPVFSSKKIKSKNYKLPEKETAWKEVKDEEGFYTASMPGNPGDITMYGMINMKMYFDIFSSTVYMTSAIRSPYSQKIADSIMGLMASYYFSADDYTDGKPITINGVPGREFSDKISSRGYLMFSDGVMYMALGISVRKDSTSAKDVNRFLKSFTILQKEKVAANFITYTDKEKAFSIDLPAMPKSMNDALADNSDKSLKHDLKISLDPETGAYYFVGVNEANAGYFLDNDINTVKSLFEKQKQRLALVNTDTIYFKNGRRVAEFAGIMKEAPLMTRGQFIFRGNRWYAFLVIYDTSKPAAGIDRFFNSFKELEYMPVKWQTQTSGDNNFNAWLPGTLEDITDEDKETTLKYIAYDSTTSTSFVILPEHFGKYYWQNSDSIFWDNIIKKSTGFFDTLISRKAIINGDTKGWEIVTQKEGSGNTGRKRILLHGDTLYTLTAHLDAADAYSENISKFFEDFHFNEPAKPSTVFTSKAKRLMADAASKDSATLVAVNSFFYTAPFTTDDLPLLHTALLKWNPADTFYYEPINERIKEKIISFGDTSSLRFAKENYAQADDSTRNLLLDIMTSYHTKENYDEIQNLLLTYTPRTEPGYSFANNLSDSLQLAAAIIPDLLPLMKDSLMQSAVLAISSDLLDSSLLDISLLLPYKNEVIKTAQKEYLLSKADPEYYGYTEFPVINILGKLNSVESNAMLQKWLSVKFAWLQIEVIEQLLNNKQTVSAQVIQKLAQNDESRTDIYNTLKKYHKEGLFPAQYLTQKYFAQSMVYEAASEDDGTPTGLTWLTQKQLDFNGSQARFFFFKVTYGIDDYMLACAGPFNTDTKDMSADKAYGSLYYDEDFDPSDLQRQMDEIIKQMKNEVEGEDKDDDE